MARLQNTIVITALAIVAVVVSGCDSSGIAGPRDFARLAQAEARWGARPFADYRYEIRVSCFCPPELTQWTRVTVRDGAVVDAEAVDPNAPYPITTTVFWWPIDTLFSGLRRAMRESGWDSPYAEIEVSYDRELGYPTFIAYREKPTVADGGATYEVRQVRPLE